MNRSLWVGSVALFMSLTAISIVTPLACQERSGEPRLLGAWRLAWLESPGAGGKLHRIECCGMLVFTPDGHISVQVMEPAGEAAAASGPEQYSQGGYEASYGSYAVDKRDHTFTFHVDGALVRTLIGQDLKRNYEFSGEQLIVKSTRPDEHWRVAWERF
jgi:hypothetical protein